MSAVFFVGTLGAERDSMPHMKAIVFCRATADNLRMLADELASPKHSEYHIYLSNICPPVRAQGARARSWRPGLCGIGSAAPPRPSRPRSAVLAPSFAGVS